MELNETLRNTVKMWGADFWGVADLSSAKKAVLDQGGNLVAQYPFAISIGIALSHSIVDQAVRKQG